MGLRETNYPEGFMLPLVEEFYTIQGEGYHAGEAAWFIRLGGCDVGCNWCDSRFSWDPDMFPLVETDSIVCNALDSGTIHPRGRTGVPGPSAAAHMRRN